MLSVTVDAITTPVQHDSKLPKPHKPPRRAHKKVRTGCITCKIRRKKCDETKPACTRCTSTGRKCDGYANLHGIANKPVADIPDVENTTSPLGATPSDILPSAWPRSEMQFEHPKETDFDALKARAVPGKLFSQRELRSPNGLGLLPSTSETEVPGQSGSFSSSLSNNACASMNQECAKSEEEEWQDFISGYVKPMAPDKGYSSIAQLTRNTRSASSLPSRYQSTFYTHPRLSGIIFNKPAVPRSLFPYRGQISDIERHCFTYFRYRTGPTFSAYFDGSIWRTYAISAALAHPVVLSCAAACGAAHRRWSFGISREAFEYCAHADRLHRKALHGLQQLKRSVSENPSGVEIHDRDVVMMSEMLLGIFQGFQGEYQRTVSHFTNGIKQMLGRRMTLVHSESRYCPIANKPSLFSHLIKQLNCRASQLFQTPTKLLVKWGQGRPLPPVPRSFNRLEDARDFLFTEVDWIMHVPARIWQLKGQTSGVHDLHVRRLLKWSVAYANTVEVLERTSEEKKACILLNILRSLAYLLLHLTLFVDGGNPSLPQIQNVNMAPMSDTCQQSCPTFTSKKLWDAIKQNKELSTNLERLKIFVEDILEDNGIFNYDEHSISLDSTVGPWKCFPIVNSAGKSHLPEASEKARHLVTRPVQRKPEDCSLWESLGVYGVAERLSAVEGHAIIDAVRGIIPASVDPKWVDVTCLMESRRVLLRFCRQDEYGLGMIWTQEWWTF